MNRYDLLGIIAIVCSLVPWLVQWRRKVNARDDAKRIADVFLGVARHHDDIILHELDQANPDIERVAYSRGVREVARTAWQSINEVFGGK